MIFITAFFDKFLNLLFLHMSLKGLDKYSHCFQCIWIIKFWKNFTIKKINCNFLCSIKRPLIEKLCCLQKKMKISFKLRVFSSMIESLSWDILILLDLEIESTLYGFFDFFIKWLCKVLWNRFFHSLKYLKCLEVAHLRKIMYRIHCITNCVKNLLLSYWEDFSLFLWKLRMIIWSMSFSHTHTLPHLAQKYKKHPKSWSVFILIIESSVPSASHQLALDIRYSVIVPWTSVLQLEL